MKKKIIALLGVISIIASMLAFSFNSLANTFTNISLDTIYTSQISGETDMVWYTYTPDVSGMYSFVSYTTGKTKAYLYYMETDEFGIRSYKGLAYAPASDPDYMNEDVRSFVYGGKTYTHTSSSFRLSYHLVAGTTYYFSAGFTSDSATSGTISVRLKNDSYDNARLQSISLNCDAELTAYTDGNWANDPNGGKYYYYNYSKIIQNMIVTLHYADGSSVSSIIGANTVDGFRIEYSHNQAMTHWYAQETSAYAGNTLTVKVGNVSADYDVRIQVSSLYPITGKICDIVTGDPIPNASLSISNTTVATTDENGEFNFVYSSGYYYMYVEAPHSVRRRVLISFKAGDNKFTDPIGIVSCDYVSDGIVNVMDYAYISKSLSGVQRIKAKQTFNGTELNFTTDKYPTNSISA